MPNQTLIGIGAGLLSAMAATAVLSPVPGGLVIAYLAPMPLFAAGLATGPRGAGVAAAVGFMLAGLIGGATWAGVYGLSQGLPAWMVTRHLLLQRPAGTGGGAAPGQVTWYPLGDMLCGLTMLAAAGFVTVAVFSGGLSVAVSDSLNRVVEVMLPNAGPARQAEAVSIVAPLFPGAIGSSWLIMVIFNAALAQALLVKLGRNIRPSPPYAALTLPNWMSWPLVGSAALALLGSGDLEYTGRNLAMILAVPYLLLGLAVVHTWARRRSYTSTILIAVYATMAFWVWATVAIVGVGLAEQWSGLRHRIGSADDDGGDGNDRD